MNEKIMDTNLQDSFKNIAARAPIVNYNNLKRKYAAATPADGMTQKTLARAIVTANTPEALTAAVRAHNDFIKDLQHRCRNNNNLAGSERR